MAELALQHAVEQFLFREARLLDDGRFDDWLALFADDALYWMPARETRAKREDELTRPGELAIFEDDKQFLGERIRRLEGGLAHAEMPPSRTRRLVTNVEIVAEEAGEVEVRSNFILFQARRESSEIFYVGSRTDRLRRAGDSFKIARRKIVLDQTLVPRSISVFF